MRALSIAATGMLAQQTNVEVIANNLANMNTTGFKEQRAEFQDLLYQNISTPGANSSDSGTVLPSGIQLGAGVRTAAVYRVTTQGDLQEHVESLRPRDPAARATSASQPDGTDAYTRAGNFALSPEGQLVTDQGYTVAPGIAIPTNALVRHDQRARPGLGDRARPDRAADRRHARTDALRQRGAA